MQKESKTRDFDSFPSKRGKFFHRLGGTLLAYIPYKNSTFSSVGAEIIRNKAVFRYVCCEGFLCVLGSRISFVVCGFFLLQRILSE